MFWLRFEGSSGKMKDEDDGVFEMLCWTLSYQEVQSITLPRTFWVLGGAGGAIWLDRSAMRPVLFIKRAKTRNLLVLISKELCIDY